MLSEHCPDAMQLILGLQAGAHPTVLRVDSALHNCRVEIRRLRKVNVHQPFTRSLVMKFAARPFRLASALLGEPKVWAVPGFGRQEEAPPDRRLE